MNYPWYEEVGPGDPLDQGDLIEACPVSVFVDLPALSDVKTVDDLLGIIRTSVAVEQMRVIVMTQGCDLEHGKIRNVILCPIYHLDDYRADWEALKRGQGQAPTERGFRKVAEEVTNGRVWNLTMLDRRVGNTGEISIPRQIVDFHEIFSLPLDFLSAWVRLYGGQRLRLLSPYREHLSQSFARFFMRVGLPEDINLP